MTAVWQPERAQLPSVAAANFVVIGRSYGHCEPRTLTGNTSVAVV
jgi:hypothetical protein